jgi:putative oxidoreductase
MTLPAPARDLVILLTRLGVGVVMFAHGWQKFFTYGIDGAAAGLGQAGVPAPALLASLAAGVELLGGAALVLGLLVPVVGVLLALDMLGAFVLVHAGNGVFVDQGGFELVLALGVASLLLAVIGAGRYSLDRVLPGLRRTAVPA